jgi:hypothetical protein
MGGAGLSTLDGSSDKHLATKYMFWILIFSLIPFPVVFYANLMSPDSVVLNFIANKTEALPGMTSIGSPLLSEIMSSYCKLAPVFSFIFFMLTYDKLRINTSLGKAKTFKVLVVFLAFYIVVSYFLLFYDVELTESKRFLHMMSQTETLLTLLYCIVFSAIYILTCYLLSFIYAAILIFKK